MDLPPEALALLALPPARFTAERNNLAKALAERGDPAARAVSRLARPVGLAWVLNRLARDHPGEIRALLAAGDRLRAAQLRAASGAGGEALRTSEAALREGARALRLGAERILAEAGRPAAALPRLELLLRVAATGSARGDLEAGTLAREPSPGDAELSGLTLLAGGPAAPPATTAQRPARPARGVRAAAAGVSARQSRKRPQAPAAQAVLEARDAEQRRRERARATKKAHAEAQRARARAEKEEHAAADAEERARAARARAAEARAEANRLAKRALEVERTGAR